MIGGCADCHGGYQRYAVAGIQAGANGYILKDTDEGCDSTDNRFTTRAVPPTPPITVIVLVRIHHLIEVELLVSTD